MITTKDKTAELVSVVIPAFNCAALIERAIQSVRVQSWPAVEIIVVDDGSQDNTSEIVESIGRSIRLIRQRNAGPAAARNRGIKEARGEFIAFLDADDEWLPGRLQQCLEPMIADPQIGMTWCWALISYDGGEEEIRGKRFERFEIMPNPFWPHPRHCTPATTCRKSVLERTGGFEETLRCWEDQDLWIRMREQSKVKEIPAALVRVHRQDRSASTSLELDHKLNDYLRVMERAFERRPDLYKPDEAAIRAFTHWHAGMKCLSAGANQKARHHFQTARQYSHNLKLLPLILATFFPPRLIQILK